MGRQPILDFFLARLEGERGSKFLIFSDVGGRGGQAYSDISDKV